MARKVLAFLAAAAVIILCVCPPAAAQDTGWRAEIPLAGLPARLDQVGSGKTLDLIALADGDYMFSLIPLRMDGKSWVRAVLRQKDGFLGMCLLGTREDFGKIETLAVEFGKQGTMRFTALPEGRELALVEIPLVLEGEYRLLPLAQTQGVTVTGLAAPPPAEADPAPDGGPGAQPEDNPAKPPPLRLSSGTYILALLATALVLAALVLGNIHWRRITQLAGRLKKSIAALLAGLAARRQAARETREAQKVLEEAEEVASGRARDAVPSGDTQEIPPIPQGPYLPGLRVAEPGDTALVRQITMRTAWETAAEPLEDIAQRANEYFLGRAALPAEGRFHTVGLRNRDALQQLGGSSVRPLFAANPRGQIFSLEEESGGLYLHVDYFAPPSFLLQPVLRSVCLECVFSLEDARGNPLRLENVLGHSILGITPARTTRTESGYIVAEKGRLVIGEN